MKDDPLNHPAVKLALNELYQTLGELYDENRKLKTQLSNRQSVPQESSTDLALRNVNRSLMAKVLNLNFQLNQLKRESQQQHDSGYVGEYFNGRP